MVQWKERFYITLFILAAIALSVVARAQTNTAASAPSQQTVVNLAPEEAKFLQILNNFRTKLGLPALVLHTGLQTAALKHSTWMADQDATQQHVVLNHNGPTPTTTFADRIKNEDYADYTTIGENIACGSRAAEDTFKQFAFSPGHLANMINPEYRNIGISRAGTGNEECPYYWTNDFGSKEDLTDGSARPSDLTLIAGAIDAALGKTGDTPTLKLLNAHHTESPAPAPNGVPTNIKCVIPYALGNGSVSYAVNTNTTVEVTPNDDQYLVSLTYQQEGTQVEFQSYTISGVSVVKNPDYPILTVFSAPTTHLGGFTLEINLSNRRSRFDPYPGHGGASGPITCQVK